MVQRWRICPRCRRLGFGPWRRQWQPTPVFLPGKSHGQRSLADTVHGVARVEYNLAQQQKTCQNWWMKSQRFGVQIDSYPRGTNGHPRQRSRKLQTLPPVNLSPFGARVFWEAVQSFHVFFFWLILTKISLHFRGGKRSQPRRWEIVL